MPPIKNQQYFIGYIVKKVLFVTFIYSFERQMTGRREIKWEGGGCICARERERDSLPSVLLSRWLQQVELGQSGARSIEPRASSRSSTGARDASTPLIFHCFPKHISTKTDQKWSSQDLTGNPIGCWCLSFNLYATVPNLRELFNLM